MLHDKTFAAVVQAYNDESQIVTVIKTMPVFVATAKTLYIYLYFKI